MFKHRCLHIILLNAFILHSAGKGAMQREGRQVPWQHQVCAVLLYSVVPAQPTTCPVPSQGGIILHTTCQYSFDAGSYVAQASNTSHISAAAAPARGRPPALAAAAGRDLQQTVCQWQQDIIKFWTQHGINAATGGPVPQLLQDGSAGPASEVGLVQIARQCYSFYK